MSVQTKAMFISTVLVGIVALMDSQFAWSCVFAVLAIALWTRCKG